jgi:hypothetical protein
VTGGLLAATAGVAALADSLVATLERTGSGPSAPPAEPDGLRVVSAGLPNPSPVAVVALAFAACPPLAVGGAHLLARALARR